MKLGLKKAPYDIRDRKYRYEKLVSLVSLPESFDCRPYMLGIKDQDQSNECAAFSGAEHKEYQEIKETGKKIELSPQYIYDLRENKPEPGMDLRDLMKIICSSGVAELKDYSFTEKDNGKDPSMLEIEKAKRHKSDGYSGVTTIEGAKQSIVNNGPLVIGLPVYNFGDRFWIQRPGDYLLGYHAVKLVAYFDQKFILRNSWGVLWYGGEVDFPFTDWPAVFDARTSIDAKTLPEPTPEPVQWIQKIWNAIVRFFKRIFS